MQLYMRSSLTNAEVSGPRPSLSLGSSSRLGRSVVSQANRPLSFSGLCVSRFGTGFPSAISCGWFAHSAEEITASGDIFRITTLTFIVWVFLRS